MYFNRELPYITAYICILFLLSLSFRTGSVTTGSNGSQLVLSNPKGPAVVKRLPDRSHNDLLSQPPLRGHHLPWFYRHLSSQRRLHILVHLGVLVKHCSVVIHYPVVFLVWLGPLGLNLLQVEGVLKRYRSSQNYYPTKMIYFELIRRGVIYYAEISYPE